LLGVFTFSALVQLGISSTYHISPPRLFSVFTCSQCLT